MNVARKQNSLIKVYEKNNFFANFFRIIFSLCIKRWNKISFMALFVEIGWEFSGIYDLMYHLGSIADENVV